MSDLISVGLDAEAHRARAELADDERDRVEAAQLEEMTIDDTASC